MMMMCSSVVWSEVRNDEGRRERAARREEGAGERGHDGDGDVGVCVLCLKFGQ
jgi:hypothetical protein